MKMLFPLILLLYSCVGAYDPEHEDYVLNNYFHIPIVVRTVDFDDNQQLIYIPINEGRVVKVYDFILSENNIISIDKFNSYFKIFEIYSLEKEKIEIAHIISDVEYVTDSYGYYFNINLRPNEY